MKVGEVKFTIADRIVIIRSHFGTSHEVICELFFFFLLENNLSVNIENVFSITCLHLGHEIASTFHLHTAYSA